MDGEKQGIFIGVALAFSIILYFGIVALVISLSDEPDVDAYRGCVASAYQAEHRGAAGTTLEANLSVCDILK